MIQDTLKRTAFGAARVLRAHSLARRMLRARLRVFCYHGVLASDEGRGIRYRNTVTRDEFAMHVRTLVRHEHPVGLDAVIAWAREGRPLPPRAVLVTFDDGYRNNLTVAAPILKEHGVPALVAVTTDHIGRREMLWPTEVDHRVIDGRWERLPLPSGSSIERPSDPGRRDELARAIRGELKRGSNAARLAWLEVLRAHTDLDENAISRELVEFLDWDEVRKLREFGVEIASHTVHHPILSRLDRQELDAELADSKARIERETGAPCRSLVFPNGKAEDLGAPVTEAVARAGYLVSFDLTDRVNPERCRDPLHIHRIEMPPAMSPGLFAARESGLYAMLRGRVDP
ncbi:MAG: polysaccharide deacetylase family protein [Planctomycetota bacterium]